MVPQFFAVFLLSFAIFFVLSSLPVVVGKKIFRERQKELVGFRKKNLKKCTWLNSQT